MIPRQRHPSFRLQPAECPMPLQAAAADLLHVSARKLRGTESWCEDQ